MSKLFKTFMVIIGLISGIITIYMSFTDSSISTNNNVVGGNNIELNDNVELDDSIIGDNNIEGDDNIVGNNNIINIINNPKTSNNVNQETSNTIDEKNNDTINEDIYILEDNYILESPKQKKGKAYTDPLTNATISITQIYSDYKADGIITLPGEDSKPFLRKSPGDKDNFIYNKEEYSIMISEIIYYTDEFIVEVKKISN